MDRQPGSAGWSLLPSPSLSRPSEHTGEAGCCTRNVALAWREEVLASTVPVRAPAGTLHCLENFPLLEVVKVATTRPPKRMEPFARFGNPDPVVVTLEPGDTS